MKKRNRGGGASWMDTYGDMVTLLLCFFVLLYSMSTIDQQKWLILVQSFNPDAVIDEENKLGNDGPVNDPQKGESVEVSQEQEQIDQDIEDLYEKIKAYVAEQGSESTIEVSKGSGGEVYLSFNEAVFFGGNSYYLREDGKQVLDEVGQLISEVRNSIDELAIIGHTAQADPEEFNDVTADRFLASNRATVVEIYLQEKNVVDPERMVSMERGQWRPVATNDTSEGRAQNRRVEMVVTGRNLASELGDSVQEYYASREIEPPPNSGVGAGTPVATPAPSITPAGTAAPESEESPGASETPAAAESPGATGTPAPAETPAATPSPPQTQLPAPDGTSD